MFNWKKCTSKFYPYSIALQIGLWAYMRNNTFFLEKFQLKCPAKAHGPKFCD